MEVTKVFTKHEFSLRLHSFLLDVLILRTIASIMSYVVVSKKNSIHECKRVS